MPGSGLIVVLRRFTIIFLILLFVAEQAEPYGWSSSISVDAVDDVPVLIPIGAPRRHKEAPADRADMSLIYRVRIVRNPAISSGVIVYITKQTYMPVAAVQV